MGRIHIEREHQLSQAELNSLVSDLSDRLADAYQLRIQQQGDAVHFSRSGARGTLLPGPSTVVLTLELGLLLRPFRDGIHAAIEQQLDTLLG
ncbi:polyhydroxyalkanoic acid system family protein [Ferrimonas balearica]|uniref:polyhydroxyalkanoic acid system family protein n=1 Tax=Ferrimonas balearica TaxID=44012 RepID=UPI001C565CD2|nr:polyhydroxyalkanoic acid system family protein [Ferrimonas balearica]MBW3165264.1 polyhydroxyalkanoic acid system family protein [Ferrimonas balearica]MBY6107437.1 polyhydroxyalkanoic acid system family protein [Ferrimonas balearica]